MIVRLRGTLLEVLPNRLVIDVQGVGYLVNVPLSTYDACNPLEGQTIDLHIHMHVRETAHTLYGFKTKEEKELFVLLIDRVSGIGPAIGMAVLSGMGVEEFKSNVVGGHVEALSKIKGLGKKTAERIVLELKDKVGVTEGWKSASETGEPSVEVDAELGLIGLGYKKQDARKAIGAVKKSSEYQPDNTGELLKAALRVLNGI